jgi:hypothetical protein
MAMNVPNLQVTSQLVAPTVTIPPVLSDVTLSRYKVVFVASLRTGGIVTMGAK